MSDRAANPEAGKHAEHRPFLKLLVEIGPLVVFFIVNGRAGIFYGTGAFMAATVVALAASHVLFGRIPAMPLVSGLFIVVFGGLTLWLQDELFIKMKPTIVNALFAAALFGGLALDKPLFKYLFGDVFKLTDEGWRRLTLRWAVFFLALAALNEIVWRSFSTDVWVSFKLFAVMPLTFAFALAQIGLLKRFAHT
jgi:intracellular septation protein